jgi:DNA-binding XRE family transcriptional regulator
MPTRPLTPAQKAHREALQTAVGHRLKLVRRALDQTQEEFVHHVGISPNAYTMIERGDRLPSIETAIALCEAHRISMDWIFRGEPGDMSARLWDSVKALQLLERHGTTEG